MVMPEETPMVTEEEALRRVGDYLRDLFEVDEIIYDITDKIARARSVSDLLEGLYAALRLKEKLKKENPSAYTPGSQDIETIRKLAEASEPGLRLVSRYIACLAMAYRPKRKEE